MSASGDLAAAVPHARGTSATVILGGALLAVVLASILSPALGFVPPPVGGSVLDANLPLFSPGHVFGTDMNGNDIWSRLAHGGRTSLLTALAVNAIGLSVGGSLGALAGYLGGTADAIIARFLDALLAFPSLILVLAVAQALGPGYLHTIGALCFFSIPAFARVSRAATLRLREEPFILAARLCGTGLWRTLARHITPNILPQLIAYALLGVGLTINIEGAVSFLGLGVPLPQPSWGNMIYQGQATLTTTPLLVILPAAYLCFTILAFNLLSDAVRRRADLY